MRSDQTRQEHLPLLRSGARVPRCRPSVGSAGRPRRVAPLAPLGLGTALLAPVLACPLPMETHGTGCCAACGCAQRHAPGDSSEHRTNTLRSTFGVESPDSPVVNSETDQLIPELYGPLPAAGPGRSFCERLRGRVTLLVGLLVRRRAPTRHGARSLRPPRHTAPPHECVWLSAGTDPPPPSRSVWQIFQSVSSFILASYSELLQQHSAELTRTPQGLRRVRTGYAYQPPA